jgi:hypothetical protein
MMMRKIPKKPLKNSESIENRAGRNDDILGLAEKRKLNLKFREFQYQKRLQLIHRFPHN